MSEYKQVKIGKLKLKGHDSGKIKKQKKKRKFDDKEDKKESLGEDLSKQYNGWWSLKGFEHLNCGTVAIQTSTKNSYIYAVDNGTLTLGNYHEDESEDLSPVDQEIFTMIRISENKIALKSGYGKYVSVNARGDIFARSEAVGPQEQIEVVIEDGKIALQGHNGYFITVTDENEMKALSRIAKERETFCLRTNASKNKKKKASDEEEVGNVRQFEITYVKQFQSFKDHRLKLHQGPSSSLEKAKTKGKLHEAMLDRREKMKADRYCK